MRILKIFLAWLRTDYRRLKGRPGRLAEAVESACLVVVNTAWMRDPDYGEARKTCLVKGGAI